MIKAARLHTALDKQLAIEKMAELLSAGMPVVLGTYKVVEPGTVIGRAADKTLAIKRRATREEFLKAAPAMDADTANAEHSPFYWELELSAAR